MPLKALKTIFVFLFFQSSWAQASSLYTPNLNSRTRAMGGTSIGYVKGVDALFNNAASLARVDGFSLKIADVNVGASKNSQRLIDQGFGSGNPISAADLQSLFGETYFSEVSAQTGMVFPRFGFGIYSTNTVSEVFNNPVFPTFNVDFLSEYGYLVAGSIPLGDRMSFGITGRSMKRWSGNKDLLVTDLLGATDETLIQNNFLDKGAGEAFDLSFLAQLPQNVSIAAVWKDVGDTAFRPSSGNGPERQEENLSFGIAKTDQFGFIDMTYAFEYNHIRQIDSIGKKLHLGTEVSMGLFDLRAGLSQGYLTYGAAVDLWLISIEAAAYTEELGTSAGQSRSDRYQATISINLDFDQAFKLKNQLGKKRRLMQRR